MALRANGSTKWKISNNTWTNNSKSEMNYDKRITCMTNSFKLESKYITVRGEGTSLHFKIKVRDMSRLSMAREHVTLHLVKGRLVWVLWTEDRGIEDVVPRVVFQLFCFRVQVQSVIELFLQ